MKLYYLVFDLGTGNSKVSIVSSCGDILGMKTWVNQYNKDDNYTDAQFFLPQEWEHKLLKITGELLKEFSDVKISAITSSGARQSIVLYDKKNYAFLGLPNIDNRGREWMKEIKNKPEIYKKTGKWVTEDFPAAKLMGLKKKYPEEYSRINKINSLSEWIGTIFCNEIVIEPSQACETQLFDITKNEWSKDICKEYDIAYKILPDIKISGTNLGLIKP
ncbi:MAG: FGGY family carbohydrate kinase, partial [Sphaerochaetaceae bacterium]|nr:FGGY family carbohydrate kinase [Sphaerochaetaceae bacterium]